MRDNNPGGQGSEPEGGGPHCPRRGGLRRGLEGRLPAGPQDRARSLQIARGSPCGFALARPLASGPLGLVRRGVWRPVPDQASQSTAAEETVPGSVTPVPAVPGAGELQGRLDAESSCHGLAHVGKFFAREM